MMADGPIADTGTAACCTCCGLCIFSAMESWCNIHAFGADVCSCSGPRGCCGSCCDASFDKDDFDERMKHAKDAANPEPVKSQPGPSDAMSPVAANSNPAKSEDV